MAFTDSLWGLGEGLYIRLLQLSHTFLILEMESCHLAGFLFGLVVLAKH